MFTGIVQTKAKVLSIAKHGQFLQLTLAVKNALLAHVEVGASIATNGCCLTVTQFDEVAGTVCFDVIDETLRKTNLGGLVEGDDVNFERSLTFGKEIGGHLVSGHVHTTAIIVALNRDERNCHLQLEIADKQWSKYILEKGFIAVDGASLTVGQTKDGVFDLHLIPETLNITRLGDCVVGDKVNIEIDSQTQTIVDTVERVLADRLIT